MIGTEAQDPQRDAVHSAEEIAEAEFYDRAVDGPGQLTTDSLTAFVQGALDAAGWDPERQPAIDLDVADDDDRSGWYEGKTGVIHLHPQLLRSWTVLHELAHWVDPRNGHGPRFCANFVELVRGSLGPEAGQSLMRAFEELGVEVDQEWLV